MSIESSSKINIKINPEYSKLINPLSKSEYECIEKFNKQ